MKKKNFLWSLLTIVMAATLSVGLSSCKDKDDDDPPAPTLSVEKTTVTFSAGGGNTSISVTSNTKWSVTGGDSWLTVTKSSTAISLSASKNESTEKKETTITVKTDDGSLSQSITVIIEGAEQILELSGLDAAFEKTDNTQQNAQELTITCNAGWEISGKPEWLNISNLKGNGNMSIKVWPSSVNNSTERKATLIVKSGSKEVSKDVIQKGISSAYARPKDIVTLTESSVWGYDFTSNLHHVSFTLMREIIANGYTDADILKEIENDTEDNWVRRTPQQFKEYGGYFSWYGLTSDTKWMLISVAFDENNEVGEVNRQLITTKKDDIYNSPYIAFDHVDLSYEQQNGQYYYRIKCAKDSYYSAYANKFYSWAVASTKEFDTWYAYTTHAILAYLITQEIKKNPQPHDTYVNGTDRSEVRERIEGPVDEASYTIPANIGNDKYLQVVNWCTLPSGDFSGKLSLVYANLESNSRQKISVKKAVIDNNPKVIQFNPQNYKVIRLN